MKYVGIKLEGKGPYEYYVSASTVEEKLYELRLQLKEGDAIEIKCGREHYYIDYDADEKQDVNVFCYVCEITRVMKYIYIYVRNHCDIRELTRGTFYEKTKSNHENYLLYRHAYD